MNAMKTSQPSEHEENQADTTWRPMAFDRSDIIILCCGIAAALFLLAYYTLIDEQQTPWDRRWILAFPLLWSWLLPLALGLLADLRSASRWMLAIAVYAIVLPALSALSLLPVGGVAPLDQPTSLIRTNPLGTLLMPTLLGFLLMPLIRALDKTQPLCNYAGVARAAWRIVVQGMVAGALTLGVLTLLYLGAQLFELIGLTLFVQLFEKGAFWRIMVPCTFAISLISIQRRPQLVIALQRSWFTLNGWMLPLASVIGVTFVVALGAQLVFGMRAGTLSASVLIGFAAVWIKLVNGKVSGTWQDGSDSAPSGPALGRLLRWSLYCLLPLAALALYNVLVRVDQYGWTVSRVWAAFAATLAVIYSTGYAVAAVRPTQFYAGLAYTNYAAAFFTIVLFMVLSTPVLDPRRVMAESQIQRLIKGQLALAQFDFFGLTLLTGPYGRIALQRLADGAANDRDLKIADLAKQALAGRYPPAAAAPVEAQKMPPFAVQPSRRVVPPKWWSDVSAHYPSEVGDCMPMAAQHAAAETPTPRCTLIFVDLFGAGQNDLILYVPNRKQPAKAGTFRVFRQNEAGVWWLDRPLTP